MFPEASDAPVGHKSLEKLQPKTQEEMFAEFRRKVRDSEMLSASMEKILHSVQFSGRLSVVVHNGRVLKSGYEEGYFTRRKDQRLVP